MLSRVDKFKLSVLAIPLIYKNFVYWRNKVVLIGLIAVGLFSTVRIYLSIQSLGLAFKKLDATSNAVNIIAILATVFAFLAWFVLFPCVIYLIDYKRNPQRIREISRGRCA